MMNKKIILHGVICFVFFVLIIWSASLELHGQKLDKSSDANQLLRMGYYIYHNHTFSVDVTESENPKPTAYREPSYSLYHALVISLHPRLQRMTMAELFDQRGIEIIQHAQIPILVAVSFLTMYLTVLFTKRMLYGYIALLLTGFSMAYVIYLGCLKIELFAAMWIILLSIMSFKVIQKKTPKWFVLAGITLSVLVLTKAIFMYFIVILLLFLFYLYKKGVFNKKRLLWGVTYMLVPYIFILGSWMTRNYVQFGKFYITHRAGIVLLARSQYDMMNAKEYFGSFLYWTLFDPYAKQLMETIYGKNAVESGGVLWNLNRDNPDGYYRKAWAISREIGKENKGEEAVFIEKRERNLGLKLIFKHPFRHLFTSIPFAWCGIFVERGFRLNVPCSVVLYSTVFVNVIYFVSLFAAFFISIKRKYWELFIVLLPALYLYGMNTLLTHNIPRYNDPAIPLLVIASLFFIRYLKNRTKNVFPAFMTNESQELNTKVTPGKKLHEENKRPVK